MDSDNGLEPYRKEAREAHLENQKRLHAIKEQRLDGTGKWPIEAFSAPGEMRHCEHVFLRKMVLGAQPEYYCDDCESELVFSQPFGRPKQHIVPVSLMKIAWAMKYYGPEEVATHMLRPHTRLDKEGHPELPPIEVIRERKAQWEELGRILDEYEVKALEEGEDNSKANGSFVLEQHTGDGPES